MFNSSNLPKCGIEECVDSISGKTTECEHNFCAKCERDVSDRVEPICPLCRKPFILTDKKDSTFAESEENLNKFRERCNNFFMFIINGYCFKGSDVPDEKLISFILSCVTCKSRSKTTYTKKDYVFDDVIDPNPTLRSFALKNLLKYAETSVLNELNRFFSNLKRENSLNEIQDVSLVVISCIEDEYALKYLKLKKHEILDFLLKNLENCKDIMQANNMEDLPSQIMAAIGIVRFCLKQITSYFIESIREGEIQNLTISEALRSICRGENDMPRFFLIKCIYQLYGMNKIFELYRVRGLEWLIPPNTFPDTSHPDVFSLYDKESYKFIRNCFDSKQLDMNRLNDLRNQISLYLLALYSSISASESNKLSEEVCLTLLYI